MSDRVLWSLDRVEEGTAVLISTDGERMDFPAERLGENLREGDMFLRSGESFTRSEDTASRRKRNAERTKALFGKK